MTTKLITMTKRTELIDVVLRHRRRTAKEYATLTGRPRASVRRDLAELALLRIVERAWDRLDRSGPMYWVPVNTNVQPGLSMAY